jgi:hypothetical protein
LEQQPKLYAMKLQVVFLNFAVIALLPIISYSQISITNTAEIEKIKSGTTFFAMKDPASPKAISYVEAIKKHWTFNKVECIKYTDVEKNIAPNNSFVTITANMSSSNANDITDSYIYLEFWTTNGKFVYDAKKRKHFNQEDKISIATIDLFADAYAQNNPSSLYKMDYDMGGHFKNWGVGIFSNYIQRLTLLLGKSERLDAAVEYTNLKEYNNLASSTLYIPDYVLTKFSKNSDDESKKYEEKEIFKEISLSYKLLPMEELNEKILSDKDGFYYLLFVKNTQGRYIVITNSQTGEIAFSTFDHSSANFKAGDLKGIQNSFKKK